MTPEEMLDFCKIMYENAYKAMQSTPIDKDHQHGWEQGNASAWKTMILKLESSDE